MKTTEPFQVKYDKAFDLSKIWKTFYNYQFVNRTPPEVKFLDTPEMTAIYRNRHFRFYVVEGKDSNSNDQPVIGVKIVEVVLGMDVELCNVLRFKDVKKAPSKVNLLNGNVVSEDFVKELLKISEALIRNHPDYKDIS